MQLNGILPIWKESGMTSHDVVFKLRKLLKMKKIGHTGTLDPQVSGVLVVCLGHATKLVELLMSGDKHYRGQITLGLATETEDSSGAVIAQKPVLSPISNALIDQKMKGMEGEMRQTPPYYSAVKVNGKRLYEYARQGQTVERPSRFVQISSFKRISQPIYDVDTHTQTWEFDTICSKGTYVRTLAVDLGKALGYPSHMSALTRLATGGFQQADCLNLAQVEEAVASDTILQYIFPIEKVLQKLPSIQLSEQEYADIANGKVLAIDYFGHRINSLTSLSYENRIVAIYQVHPEDESLIKPYKMFLT